MKSFFLFILIALFAFSISEVQALEASVDARQSNARIRSSSFPSSPYGSPHSTLQSLIEKTAAEFDLPAILLMALVAVESKFNTAAVKYHPLLARFFPQKNFEERKIYASSIGLGQVVYGFHRKRCRLASWKDLLDPATNLRCSASVLNSCLVKQKHARYVDRIRSALDCYNGSSAPTQYSEKVLEVVQKIGTDR